MRQLTAYASYLDNEGLPLVGRARFYNMDGSPAVVYAWDNSTQNFIENGSVVFTNSSGQLEPQVFLDNHDYTVVFDKYIGAGTMSEDVDSESWEEQGSAIDKYNTLGITLDGEGVRCVDTMELLKETVPLDRASGNPEVVTLLGYNRPGDKDPIYYVWDETLTSGENDGSIVKVDGIDLGRWAMVGCPRYLDVRHFGAFPNQSATVDQDQRNAIQLAGSYAHANACGLFLDALPTAVYYDISGLTLYDVDSDPNARVFSANGMSTDIIGIVSIHCKGNTNGLVNLYDKEVRTSWSSMSQYGRFHPTGRLLVDAEIDYGASTTFSNIQVELFTDPGPNVTFVNCDITSVKAITGLVTLQNCILHTDWFSDSYNWDNLVSIGNTILLKNCKNADTYVLLKNKQNESDYGDLGEQVLHSATLLSGALVENCSGAALVLGNAEFHNVTLQVTLSTPGSNLNCVDSWLTIDDSPTLLDFSLNRGSIAGDGILTVMGALRLESVTIGMQLLVNGSTPVFIDCDINAEVDQVAYLASVWNVDGMMAGCRLNAKHVLKTTDISTLTHVRFIWKDNHSNIPNPIDFSNVEPHLDNSDVQPYVYEGNTGLFLPKRVPCKMAPSFTVVDPGNHGWVVGGVFTGMDVDLFIVGKRTVRCTSHFVTGVNTFGIEEGQATRFIEVTSGQLSPTDYPSNILMPPLHDGQSSMYDRAYGGQGTFWVEIEAL